VAIEAQIACRSAYPTGYHLKQFGGLFVDLSGQKKRLFAFQATPPSLTRDKNTNAILLMLI